MLHSLFRGFAFASVVAATARLQYITDHRVNVIPKYAISFNGLRVAKSHRQYHLDAAAQHRLFFYCLLWFRITAWRSCFKSKQKKVSKCLSVYSRWANSKEKYLLAPEDDVSALEVEDSFGPIRGLDHSIRYSAREASITDRSISFSVSSRSE